MTNFCSPSSDTDTDTNKGKLMTESKKKILTGKVVSDKMSKTRVVEIERVYSHPKYGKVLRRKTNVYAHDEKNLSKAGDAVKISQTRPMSKLKRFRVLEIKKISN